MSFLLPETIQVTWILGFLSGLGETQARDPRADGMPCQLMAPPSPRRQITLDIQVQLQTSAAHTQGRIIHEAGEAETSGPGPTGPRTAQYNENLQSTTTLGPEISRENLRSSNVFAKRHLNPSSRRATIHSATNQPTKNK